MTNVIDSMPEENRSTFVQFLAEENQALLEELRIQTQPTLSQQADVAEALALAFAANVGPDDDHPTELAVRIDDALSAFLRRWPGDTLDESST